VIEVAYAGVDRVRRIEHDVDGATGEKPLSATFAHD
jgi:hypothetical protein